jgi:hypothetical protein
MIIHIPTITIDDTYAEYKFLVEYNNTETEVFIQVDNTYQDLVSNSSDAALIIMLLPAMVDNHNISIKGTISEKLFNNLHELQDLIIQVIPWCNKISIEAETIDTEFVQEKATTIAGFSAGVDAFVTLKDYFLNPKYDTKLTHVLFNNLIYPDAVAKDKLSHIKKLTDTLQLPIIETRTNFHKLYAKKKIGFEQTHPIRNAAIAHLLSAKGLTFLYSSSFPEKDFEIKPWPDIAIVNKVLLPLLSSNNIEILDVGSEYTRVEKTKIVSEIDYSQDFLDICIGKKHLKSDYYNCSQCYKCMRALVTFEKLGVLNNYNKVFDLGLYEEKKLEYLKKLEKSKQLNDVDLLNFLNGN